MEGSKMKRKPNREVGQRFPLGFRVPKDLNKVEAIYKSPAEIAKMFGLSRRKVIDLAARGIIPFYSFSGPECKRVSYLFKPSEVEEALKKQTAKHKKWLKK